MSPYIRYLSIRSVHSHKESEQRNAPQHLAPSGFPWLLVATGAAAGTRCAQTAVCEAPVTPYSPGCGVIAEFSREVTPRCGVGMPLLRRRHGAASLP